MQNAQSHLHNGPKLEKAEHENINGGDFLMAYAPTKYACRRCPSPLPVRTGGQGARTLYRRQKNHTW